MDTASAPGTPAAPPLPVPPRLGGPGSPALLLRARPTPSGYVPWLAGDLDRPPLAVLQRLLVELQQL